ncbi:N-acylglucosamine 2-epimerase [Clostridiaceae bacterium]|nr:N-acylglucosamine 2-epimerase [Clostridiaceae bacterium]RKI14743.1 N-acylglucosamine 2-epimerase [bacterium 1XD21-70]
MVQEMEKHLREKLIPFWEGLADWQNGGFYGYLGYELKLERQAVKGCILNSRILWFFSHAYRMLKQESLLVYAEHAFLFLRDSCLDKKFGGVYWAMTWDGKACDETKHTYSQAFAVYALSSYYMASGRKEALELAYGLYGLIEERCRDGNGYGEAFGREFRPASNEKLSENGVMAARTMNTLLHVFEAYTELYRADHRADVADKMREILDVFADKVYNPGKRRQEVFFDEGWNSLIDLHSYGHDIEASWLLDRGCQVLGDKAYIQKLEPVVLALAKEVYQRAYRDHSLMNECENGVDDTDRIWWVQAEAVVGFLNAWEKWPDKRCFLEASEDIWGYISRVAVDPRDGSEWFWRVDESGKPVEGEPIVEPWKCPYHNGRMCMEVMGRMRRGGGSAAEG